MKKANPGFSKLLQRYRQGKCSEEEKIIVDQWFNSIHHEIADKPITENRDAIMERMWANIQSASQDEQEIIPIAERGKWWQMWPARIAAACLCVMIGFAVYESMIKGNLGGVEIAGKNVSRMTEMANAGGTAKGFTLPDNSVVTLDPGSSVYYGAEFGSKTREVVLKGSGFFQVTHNRQKPFLVFAGNIVTRVVGTSFTITSNPKNVEVAVLTGKVIVEKAGAGPTNSKGFVLTPNQKVTYYRENDHFVSGLVSEPVMIAQKSGAFPAATFNFDDVPLIDVISILEAAYGIDIVITNEQIKSCPVKADLGQHPLYTKLDIVCAALKSHYDVRGTTIIITGGQCE
jgi:transmembrane sensor